MTLHLAIKNFFQANQISYFSNGEKITFPCFFCFSEVEINVADTKWACSGCNHSGNFKTLIERIYHVRNSISKVKVYNARTEKYKINSTLNSMVKKSSNHFITTQELIRLKERLEKLFNYYEQQIP